MPHEKGQGAPFSFDNLNHSWLGAVDLATFMWERVISQLRGLVGFATGGCIYLGWFLPTCTSSPIFSFLKSQL